MTFAGAAQVNVCVGQAESLWDDALPVALRGLPEDPAALDVALSDGVAGGVATGEGPGR